MRIITHPFLFPEIPFCVSICLWRSVWELVERIFVVTQGLTVLASSCLYSPHTGNDSLQKQISAQMSPLQCLQHQHHFGKPG